MRSAQVLGVAVLLCIFFLLSNGQVASTAGCSVSDVIGEWNVTVQVKWCYSKTDCFEPPRGLLFTFELSPDGKSFIGKSIPDRRLPIADPKNPDILKGTIVGNIVSGSWKYSLITRPNCKSVPAHGTGSFTGMMGGDGLLAHCNYMELDLTADKWSSPPRDRACKPELPINGVTGDVQATKRR
jgi:hypothetical protein